MACIVVCWAPKKWVVRNSHQNPPGFPCCLIHLRQDFGVLLYMLQHIKGANYVKLFSERNSAGVHLKQLDSGQTLLSETQARAEYFAAGKRQSGQAFLNTRQDEAGSTANFQEALSSRKIALQGPHNQLIPGAKPETVWLEFSELLKVNSL